MPVVLSTLTDPIASALAALIPQLAPLAELFSSLSHEIQNTVNQLESSAKALSPATVEALERSFSNLNATIGQAAIPAFGLLIGVVERFSGIISPIAAQLAPVFHNLIAVVSGPLLDVFRTIAEAFVSLDPVLQAFVALIGLVVTTLQPIISVIIAALSTMQPILAAVIDVLSLLTVPVILFGEVIQVVSAAFSTAMQLLTLALLPVTMLVEAFGDTLTSLHDVTRAVQIVFKSAYDAVAAWFKALIKSYIDFTPIVDYLKKAFQEAAKQVILFSARIAAAFGAFGFIDALIANLGKEGKEQGQLAAPTNVAIKDFTSIARDMVTAAFAAGPGGEQLKSERDYLRDIIPILRDMKTNQNILGQLPESLAEIIKALKDLKVPTYKEIENAWEKAKKKEGTPARFFFG